MTLRTDPAPTPRAVPLPTLPDATTPRTPRSTPVPLPAHTSDRAIRVLRSPR